MASKWNMAARIRGALRQIFRMSPEHKAVLAEARVELPVERKDGSTAKRPAVWYRCAACSGLFKQGDVEVDHTLGLPPSPGSRNARVDQSWDEFIKELFYSEMQVLCKTCHRRKTHG